jgi:hypothetical protein
MVLMAVQHVLALLHTVQSSARAVEEEEVPAVDPPDDVDDDDDEPPEHPAAIPACMRQALNAAQVPVTQVFSPLRSWSASQVAF